MGTKKNTNKSQGDDLPDFINSEPEQVKAPDFLIETEDVGSDVITEVAVSEVKNSMLSFHDGNIDKGVIRDIAKRFADGVRELSSEVNNSALKAYIEMRVVSDLAEACMNEVRYEAIKEAERFDKDDRIFRGVSFEVANGANEYEYNHDPEWSRLNKLINKHLEDKNYVKNLKALKERTEILKKSANKQITDEETGEVFSGAKIKKHGAQQLKIGIKDPEKKKAK